MTEQPQDPPVRDDRTREISWPPPPDRPLPALPKEWAALRAAAAPADPPRAETPDLSAPPPAMPAPTSQAVDAPTLRASPGDDPRLPEQPTDKVGSPRLHVRPPERTLAFSSPEMVHRPVAAVQVGRAPRRWPWVVLTLLPLLVIAGAGITLLLLR